MMPQFASDADIRDVEHRLSSDPDSLPLLFERARLLDALGRTSDARIAYIDVLKRDPSHFEALNNCGTMLFNARFLSAARLLYSEAIKWHPQQPMPYVNLANTLLELGDVAGACAQYEAALALDTAYAAAHQGLSYALSREGDLEGAARHRALGFAHAPIAIVQYRGDAAPVGALVFLSAAGGNIATDGFLDDRTFLTVKLFADYYDPALPLPPHDVVFNAIGDAELAAEALVVAERLADMTDAPVINAPAAVRSTSRSAVTARLANIPGVITPKTVAFNRAILASDDAPALLSESGFQFPLLLRSPGYHTGKHFVRVESASALPGVLPQLPGDTLLAIEYLDARGSDGITRKYRVMAIGGKLYPLHLAMASQWKVHYFTADLHHLPAHAAEESAFLRDLYASLGARVVSALELIRDTLALDYAGIDFSINPDGEILLFEANATMKIVPPPPGDAHNDRRVAAERALAAARELILLSV